MKKMAGLHWRRMVVVGLAAACMAAVGMRRAAAQDVTEMAGFSTATRLKLMVSVANDDLRKFIMDNARAVTFDTQNRLVGLDFDDRYLTFIPSAIGELTDLAELHVNKNQLTRLPLEIGNLTQLTILDAEDNQLTTIPPEIGNLTELTTLNFRDNPIKSLPGSLLNLQKIKGRNPNESFKAYIERLYPNISWEGATPKMWAVVVGIAAYRDVRSLRYPDDDAYRVYAFLKSPEGGALPEDQLAVLVDEAATRTNILDEMQRLFTQAATDDIVLLFFAGHGIGEALVPFDSDGSANLLVHQDLLDILQQSRAKHKLVIADACFAGSFDRDLPNLDQEVGKLYNAFTASQGGLALLLSSKAEETSIEEAGLRQGVFSYYFIKGLSGAADANHDKIITITEAFDYISKQVQDYTHYAQNPVLAGHFDAQMPLGAVR